MKILALDADTRYVGWAIGTEDEYQTGDEIKFAGKDIDARCNAIAEWLDKMLWVHEVSVLAIEEPIKAKNVRTTIILARLGGRLEQVARQIDVRAIRVHPSTVKAAIAHGGATKEEMIKAARLIISGEVAGEHHADAVGVLFAAQNELKWEAICQT